MTTSPSHDNSVSSPNTSDQTPSTQTRMARLSSLVEIGKILGANLELNAILESVHDQIGRVFDATNFYVATCSERKEELIFAYQVEHGEVMPPKSNPIDVGLSGYLIKTRSSLIFQTPNELKSFTERESVHVIGEPPISWMGVPLIAGDSILGVMAIQSYDEKIAYEADDLEFFTTVGTQVAIAIHNANLFKASTDKVTRLSILLEIAHSLSTKLELDSLLESVCQEVGLIFDVNNFYIATHEKGSEEWEFAFQIEEGIREKTTRHNLDRGITGYILRTGKSLMFHSTEDLTDWSQLENVTVVGQLPVSWMGIPMVSQDHTVGVMAIQNYELKNAYNKNDLALFNTIASLVASAIRNAQLYQEVGTQNKKLEVTNDELQQTQFKLLQAQKLESIGQLAAGIAHEINTPIQFIGDNTRFFGESITALRDVLAQYDTILEDAVKGVKPNLDEIESLSEEYDVEYILSELPAGVAASLDGVKRVSTIVKALKAFSHPDAGDKVQVDLNAALESTAIVCRNEWKYIADLKLDLNKELPLVPCYPGDMNQVFMNLIINGAHAIEEKLGESGEKGILKISTKLEEQYFVIHIEDTGTGITEENLSRIFDPFYTTKEVGRGTGQGLAISRNIVTKKHDGKLEAKSEMGEGTTFIIHLPVTEQTTG